MVMVFILYTVAILNFLLSSVVLLNDLKSLSSRYFAAFAFFGSFWSLGASFMLYSDSVTVGSLGQFLFIVAPVWTAFFILLFSLVFQRDVRLGLITRLFLISAPILITTTYLLNSDLYINTFVNIGINDVSVNRNGYLFYTLYFIIYLGLPPKFLLKSRKARKTKVDRSKQILHAAIAIQITSVVSLFTNLIMPLLGNAHYVWAGPLTGLIFAFLISRAILRYKLFDIRLVVARSLAYLLSLGMLLIFYAAAAFLVENWLSDVLAENNIFNAVFSISILSLTAISYAPLKQRFDRLTNKLFYRDAYDPQNFLDQLNKELVSNIDLESLLKECSRIIEANLKPEYCLFGLKETEYSSQRIIGMQKKEFNQEDIEFVRSLTPHLKTMIAITDELEEDSPLKSKLRKYDIAILVRLTADTKSHEEGLGYLILGSKKSGNPYNKQDLRMIEIIANELVIAIQNALRFEEIEKFNITLQEKVDAATAELKRTNEKLKEMDETKDEFISMASHQLRTPLTSVKGYLSMVLEGDVGKVNKQQNRMLEQAFLSSQRMVYLIADLLNVSRLKTGKFVIENKITNLADVVETEVTQLLPTAKSRKLALTFQKPKDFPLLMLDETKIRQVIMNFIDNAIYYTPSGGKIEVTLEDKGETIEYRVKDSGIGVPKKEQHNLFSKFYRAGNARKARPDGTGLGLFMAKKVVIAQGGAIIFESEEGKGSTFGFTFAKNKLAVASRETSDRSN